MYFVEITQGRAFMKEYKSATINPEITGKIELKVPIVCDGKIIATRTVKNNELKEIIENAIKQTLGVGKYLEIYNDTEINYDIYVFYNGEHYKAEFIDSKLFTYPKYKSNISKFVLTKL